MDSIQFKEELTCTICHDIFKNAVTVSCSHSFCSSCITDWLKKKNHCPICWTKTEHFTECRALNNVVDVLLMEEEKKAKMPKKFLQKKKVEKVLKENKSQPTTSKTNVSNTSVFQGADSTRRHYNTINKSSRAINNKINSDRNDNKVKKPIVKTEVVQAKTLGENKTVRRYNTKIENNPSGTSSREYSRPNSTRNLPEKMTTSSTKISNTAAKDNPKFKLKPLKPAAVKIKLSNTTSKPTTTVRSNISKIVKAK